MPFGVGNRQVPGFPPRGDPDRRTPPIRRPTPREMQMRAALRAAAPHGGGRGWQGGGMVGRNMFNPSLAAAQAAAAMRRNAPPRRGRVPGIYAPPPRRAPQNPYQETPIGWTPPGDWQTGGAVAPAVAPTNLGPLPGSPAAQPGYVSPYPYLPYSTPESTYGIIPRRPSQRQMQMQAAHRGRGRGPGGWAIGGDVDVDSTEDLMAERDRLQQLLQTADEAMAQEIMAQIMEINKELEMEARNFGMAGGGVASLRGGGAPWSRGNPRFRPIRQQAPQAPMGPPARLSRPGWGSPGLDIPGGG